MSVIFFQNRRGGGCFFFALFLLFSLASPTFADEGGDALVKYRQNLMKEMQAGLQNISFVLKGQAGKTAHLAGQAGILSSAAKAAEEAFRFQTPGAIIPTDSLDRIWTEKEIFSGMMQDFQVQTRLLQDLAEKGDVQAVAIQLGTVGKSCSGCHKRYRRR